MEARAISLVPDPSEPFNLSWRGYDRAEVDAFLKRTAADRERLRVELAQLEAVLTGHDTVRRQERDRLEVLRSELARCLESSIDALHAANCLLSSPPELVPNQQLQSESNRSPSRAVPRRRTQVQDAWPLPIWLSPGRTLLAVGLVSAAVVLGPTVVSGDRVASPETPAVVDSAATVTGATETQASLPSLAAIAGAPAPVMPVGAQATIAGPAEPTLGTVAPVADELILTLTAIDECWIRSELDGGEARERLLQANDSVTLRAGDEVVLRVGDPAALRLRINDRPARTLGDAGRALTVRITRSNYLRFLAN